MPENRPCTITPFGHDGSRLYFNVGGMPVQTATELCKRREGEKLTLGHRFVGSILIGQ
jgi:hypothetical protein